VTVAFTAPCTNISNTTTTTVQDGNYGIRAAAVVVWKSQNELSFHWFELRVSLSHPRFIARLQVMMMMMMMMIMIQVFVKHIMSTLKAESEAALSLHFTCLYSL